MKKKTIWRSHATCIRGTSIHCNLQTRLTTIEMKNERVYEMGGRGVVHVYMLQARRPSILSKVPFTLNVYQLLFSSAHVSNSSFSPSLLLLEDALGVLEVMIFS